MESNTYLELNDRQLNTYDTTTIYEVNHREMFCNY